MTATRNAKRPRGSWCVREMGPLVVLAIAALGLTGCLQGNPKGPRVVAVGDSITVISGPAIAAALDPVYYEDMRASGGQRIDQMLPALSAALAADTPVHDVIENLGTNDAFQNNPGWQTSWAQMMAAVAAVPCVVLVTINQTADWFGHGSVASSVNSTIVALAAASPTRYRVIDWNAYVVAGAPIYPMLQSDGIHPSAVGQQWLAAQYKTALDSCP